MSTPMLPPIAGTNSGKTITQGGWRITTHKYPILSSTELEAMTATLGITPPEMIFGNNLVSLQHISSGFTVSFRALDALSLVDKTGAAMLRVAYSDAWQRMREEVHRDIKEVVKPYDWTFTTPYQGTVSGGAGELSPTSDEIPFERLKKPDPILMFDEVMLYEDELADNGISLLSAKVRVMPGRLLLLQRFFMRLDDVLFRIRDTRVYVEFATGEVIREYQAREGTYENVRKVFNPPSPSSQKTTFCFLRRRLFSRN